MKNIFLIMIIAALFTGCDKDLTKEPNFISEDVVFEDENLTEAYLAKIYEAIRFQDLGGEGNNAMGLIAAVGAEHTAFANWQTPNQAVLRTYSEENGGGSLTYWPYGNIRDVNYLLENIENSISFTRDYINAKIAEARFLRAYMYFELVRRYGGVPIVTKVQNDTDPTEELYPSRNTEKEVYDFIYNEINDILPLFPDAKSGVNGRADKFTALALQSRAMLYAASIAMFGEMQLEGIVGIAATEANTYYQRSYDASQKIINEGGYVLYDKSDDKVENYIQLFLDEENDEVIFAKVFEPFVKGHSFDNLATPQGFSASWNSNYPVFYDFVELYGFVEGSPITGVSRDELTDENSWDINEFFGMRDPRFRASVYYPEYEWQGGTVYFHVSTTYTNTNGEVVTVNSGTLDRDGTPWPAAAPPRNVRNTSLLVRKKVDESNTNPIANASGQNFYVFRYAEILLNHAEAAFYLDKKDEALTDLNAIRNRAGVPALMSVSEDNLRNERQVELAFEEHRYWDLKRWRIAQEKMDGVRMKGLTFKYNLDTDRYMITLKNAESVTRSFGMERYYLPIHLDWINTNPNLIQNPGY
ncbi:RagB/SusD family nutrient uptake outer membrane protein [Zhouia spongiae]|uniref:RagB/SusD family nutrient uptake outer membrane protein n=1 Tax=Zhouia spongiae TaxID=2202721 RepID=A0ABY3YJF2_9FLAO|nr:RagB/SusD family nutrient uptake outer membrane protein [Zhouia spongiae]UNY97820.1 RagB/SusD family nutrient uptake outer membrane protein [Zhouia spongiae]